MVVLNIYTECPSFVNVEEKKLITSLESLQAELPQHNPKVIQDLLNISRGPEGARMQTLGLVKCVKNDRVFTVDGKTIKLSNEIFALDLEAEACNPPMEAVPEHFEFTAEWDENIIASGKENNILGDNGGLYFNESSIQIPIVKATKETLAYYGALLLPKNTAIRFPSDEPYPIWKMHVDFDYVKNYIMRKDGGGGFYLEYHLDQPHFHMVIDGGGLYLLAKKIGENTFHITAFELSNGQAVYTKKGAIHCDAALTGDLVVGYTTSRDCSTVLLRTKTNNEILNIHFV